MDIVREFLYSCLNPDFFLDTDPTVRRYVGGLVAPHLPRLFASSWTPTAVETLGAFLIGCSLFWLGEFVVMPTLANFFFRMDARSYRSTLCSTSLSGFVDAMLVLQLSGRELWEKWSSGEYVLDAPTTDRQLLCIAICSSYMLMDGCFLLVRLPKTCPYFVPWMLHHLATIVYMLSVVHCGHGGFSVMVLIFFGEITNPLSQFYNIAGELCGLNPLTGADAPVMKRLSLRSARVYDAILPMYSPSYVCVRVVVGPCLGLHMAYIFVCQNWTGQLSGGPNKVPYLFGLYFVGITCAVLHGSLNEAAKQMELTKRWWGGERAATQVLQQLKAAKD